MREWLKESYSIQLQSGSCWQISVNLQRSVSDSKKQELHTLKGYSRGGKTNQEKCFQFLCEP